MQRRKIAVQQDQTIVFTPFVRVPYLFYLLEKSVYQDLGPEFAANEIRYRIRSLETLAQLLDLLEERQASPRTRQDFLNTLTKVYEKHRKRIWQQVPPAHPHHLPLHFDLTEIYWRRSAYQQPLLNLQKALAILLGTELSLPDFCRKWYLSQGRILDIKAFRQQLLAKRPGVLAKVRNKWERYRVIYCLAAILSRYYFNSYQDVSTDSCHAFAAVMVTLARCFQMKQERSRALGEEHPGLDYNIADMIAQILEWTQERAVSSKGWTERQKQLLGLHLYESESKHVIYSALAFLEALGEEFKRKERWDLQIVPPDLRRQISKHCRSQRRQNLENFVNEILRRWYQRQKAAEK